MNFTIGNILTLGGFAVTGIIFFVTQKNNTANNTKDLTKLDQKIDKVKASYDKVLFNEKGEHNYVSIRTFRKFEESQSDMSQLIQSIDKRLAVISSFLEMNSKGAGLKRRQVDIICGKDK